jgi:hypothetical protein
MGNLRTRDIKYLAGNHTARKGMPEPYMGLVIQYL